VPSPKLALGQSRQRRAHERGLVVPVCARLDRHRRVDPARRLGPAPARLVGHDAADPSHRRRPVTQAAAVADGAHEAVVHGVERRLLLAGVRLREPHEPREALAVHGLDGGETIVHAPTISSGRWCV
jgi:hypothetical protein